MDSYIREVIEIISDIKFDDKSRYCMTKDDLKIFVQKILFQISLSLEDEEAKKEPRTESNKITKAEKEMLYAMERKKWKEEYEEGKIKIINENLLKANVELMDKYKEAVQDIKNLIDFLDGDTEKRDLAYKIIPKYRDKQLFKEDFYE